MPEVKLEFKKSQFSSQVSHSMPILLEDEKMQEHVDLKGTDLPVTQSRTNNN
jgi:hypothetical protein